jgi:patatin-like phospholipase/acyl hydrolase
MQPSNLSSEVVSNGTISNANQNTGHNYERSQHVPSSVGDMIERTTVAPLNQPVHATCTDSIAGTLHQNASLTNPYQSIRQNQMQSQSTVPLSANTLNREAHASIFSQNTAQNQPITIHSIDSMNFRAEREAMVTEPYQNTVQSYESIYPIVNKLLKTKELKVETLQPYQTLKSNPISAVGSSSSVVSPAMKVSQFAKQSQLMEQVQVQPIVSTRNNLSSSLTGSTSQTTLVSPRLSPISSSVPVVNSVTSNTTVPTNQELQTTPVVALNELNIAQSQPTIAAVVEQHLSGSHAYSKKKKHYHPILDTIKRLLPNPKADAILSPFKKKERYTILCLDGGGMRGLTQCEMLRQIQHYCHGKPICELFDLIVGTSGGALLACLILQHMDSKAATEIYKRIGEQIFSKTSVRSIIKMMKNEDKGKYDSKAFRAIIDETFGNEALLDPENPDPKHKIAIVASELDPTLDLYETVLFRNYKAKYQDRGTEFEDITINDALSASTAAPFYLDAVNIKGTKFVSGNVVNNNPTLQAIMEARSLFGTDKKFLVINLGTGQKERSKASRVKSYIKAQQEAMLPRKIAARTGVTVNVRRLLTVCTDSDRIADDVVKYIASSAEPDQIIYQRFSPPWIGNIGMSTHKPEKLEFMLAQTKRYIRHNEFEFRRICSLLRENIS